MTKKSIVGDGITSRELEDLSPTEIRNYLRNLNATRAGKNAFDAKISRAEQWARTVLKKSGIEPDAEESGNADTPQNIALRMLCHIFFVRGFIERGDAARASRYAVMLGSIMAEASIKFRWEAHALKGEKFPPGRKLGSGGQIRKAIARRLAKDGDLKNSDLWASVKANPPRGWTVYDEGSMYRRIEGPKGGDEMSYRRFCNVASEERKKMRG